jgi:WD40 repeat protein
MGYDVLPAKELVWWDWVSGQPVRRFRLRESLYGPGGACSAGPDEEQREDWQPDGHAFDVSFCFSPWRVASAWEWTNKEDGNCVYDAEAGKCVYLETPYKTHTMRLALSADGNSLAAATVNDMDGRGAIECWGIKPQAERNDELAELSDWRVARIQSARVNTVDLEVHPTSFVFDGRFVAAGGPDAERVQFWDTSVSPDPAAVALTERDPGFDYGPLREAEVLEPGFAPNTLALSGTSGVLAIGGSALALWLPDRREWVHFPATTDHITAIEFGTRVGRLLVGTAEGDLKEWEIATRHEVWSLACGIGPLTTVTYSPDGLTCAAGGENGQVVVWDVDA